MIGPPYIGFEGPIGAGKTTLAQMLSAHLDATLILEDLDSNEFLSDFYDDRHRWSLGMQLSFLISRHEQLVNVVSPRPQPVVADYTYAKDGIFARTLLRNRELRLYEKIASSLKTGLTAPDLVVYLDAENDVLMRRIRLRNRSYEVSIEPLYLDSVRGAYEDYFASARDINVLRYDTSNLNLASAHELQELYRQVLEGCATGV